ncbi:hypothetical protein ACWEN3_25635 [Streptomyces sp. NPDC004561]
MSTDEARHLVQEIEGHLLLAATREESRVAARRAVSRLGRLTDPQQEHLERQFESEYLTLARASWRRTAERAEELRIAYETRYRVLRRRMVVCCVVGCALLAAAGLPVLAATPR